MPHPLTEADLQRMNDALAQIKDGLQQVQLAKMADIPTGESEQQLIEARDRINKIKQVYFPGR
jgi:hypothetical protein